MKKIIHTNEAPTASKVYSQAVVSNGFIFVAGQIHATSEGELIEGSTEEKLTQIMKNIKAILKVANASLNNVVKLTLYVTDIGILSEINKIYPTYFTGDLPAREAVCVQALPLGASIEISVIAEI